MSLLPRRPVPRNVDHEPARVEHPKRDLTSRIPARVSYRSGFTWIEAVFIITIVGMLLSVMLPALQGAHHRVKQALCLCNMKSVGLAAAMYAEEHKDLFPVASPEMQDGAWIKALAPYASETLSYRCPSDRSDDWLNPADSPAQRLINDRRRSYATNVYISRARRSRSAAPNSRPKRGYLKRGLIPFPAATVFLAECGETHGSQTATSVINADQWVPSLLTGLPVSVAGAEIALGRHRDRWENYAYADGHTETNSFEATFAYDDYVWKIVRDQWDPAFRLPKPE